MRDVTYRRNVTHDVPTRCSACGGVYHPASGHRWGDRVVLCGPCTRHFIAWVKAHTQRRWGGVKFYDHAATSVRAA